MNCGSPSTIARDATLRIGDQMDLPQGTARQTKANDIIDYQNARVSYHEEFTDTTNTAMAPAKMEADHLQPTDYLPPRRTEAPKLQKKLCFCASAVYRTSCAAALPLTVVPLRINLRVPELSNTVRVLIVCFNLARSSC